MCVLTCASLSCAHSAKSAGGWESLFDGETMAGWTISDSNGHGDTKSWRVVDGAIVGEQDTAGNGGIIYSDKTYGDFELELEVNPDWGLDSGVFLRSTPSGKCYQITVDYYENGNVGGIYGEGTGGFFTRNEKWLEQYKKGEWNKIRAVVRSNPPVIDVWVNDQPAVNFVGDAVLLDDAGHICLQVHAGDGYFGKKARFRNIRIRALD